MRCELADAQTVEDVLALMDWPENRKHLRWAANIGPSQVHTTGQMKANTILAELKLRRLCLRVLPNR
jgi:hypothetical protein